MTWTIDRLQKAQFLIPNTPIAIVNPQEIEDFLNGCENTVSREDKLLRIAEQFAATELDPQIANLYKSEYVFTSIVQKMYATACALPCVYVEPNTGTTVSRPFKAILHPNRYKTFYDMGLTTDEEMVATTIELLSEYLSYELKLVIGHECILHKKPIYISSPLIPEWREDNIITFRFTYST
jgi:hypothetical protein